MDIMMEFNLAVVSIFLFLILILYLDHKLNEGGEDG